MSGEIRDQYFFQMKQLLEKTMGLLQSINMSKTYPIRGTDVAYSLTSDMVLEAYEEFKKYWEDETGEVLPDEWETHAKYLEIEIYKKPKD